MSSDPVRVSFDYTPDEPDPDDATGMSAEEYDTLIQTLDPLGADDIRVERKES